ncbi:hypothetical protein GJAV_G00067190 [Gymnothorax javanicus]|nr:hypothetical protein GJAV_G00067190 [Gymnothorax javanicus]
MATEGKVIRCKAAVAWESGKPLSLEEVDVAPPKAHEVRIKKISILQIGKPQPFYRSKLRDETMKGVLSDGTTRISCRGKQLYVFFGLGTFSEYIVVSDIALTKIQPDAPLEKVCLLGCGITTGYGAAINSAKVGPGSTCAVFGLGAVGLAAVMGCKAAGPARIFAVDINKDKFPKAKVCGATDFVNPKDYDKPISKMLAEMTNGGVDFALECVGDAGVMHCLRAVFFSLRVEECDSVPKLVDDYMSKKLLLGEFITHNFPLEKINEAFDLLTSGKRVVVDCHVMQQLSIIQHLAPEQREDMATEGKVIRCKAAVAWESGKPLSLEEVEVAPPKAHEVRIKIVSAGVCHTDLTELKKTKIPQGEPPLPGSTPFPMVLGHEGAGIVESVGPGVTDFAKGDSVIPFVASQCKKCDLCLSPKTNFCRTNWDETMKGVLSDGTTRISCRGKQLYVHFGLGSFSEYIVVSDIALTKIRPDAPLEKVCLLGCGITTGYGAAINSAKVQPGSTCAVFGLGAVGLAAVMGCKAAGASRIFAIDINKDKFPKAKVCGATDFVNPKDYDKPISKVLAEMTNGGVDFALECVGNAGVMRAALESCRMALGTCVIIGALLDEDMSLDSMSLLLGRTLKGTFLGGWKSVDSVPKLVDDYMNKKLLLDEFITHNFPLEKINEAFDLLACGKSIRSVITMA